MIPFTLCCSTCKEFSYRGKKFNSRKEIIQDQTYLGIHMHRFFIKCPRCASEICFRTDPETADYKVRRRKFSKGFLGFGGQGSLLRGVVLWVLGLEDWFGRIRYRRWARGWQTGRRKARLLCQRLRRSFKPKDSDDRIPVSNVPFNTSP